MHSAKRRGGRISWRLWGPVAAVAVIVVGWLAFQALRSTQSPSGRIPGPVGGPEIAQDVNTMVGQQARVFSLPDGEEKTHTVTPGQGKTIIVISHMGFN